MYIYYSNIIHRNINFNHEITYGGQSMGNPLRPVENAVVGNEKNRVTKFFV